MFARWFSRNSVSNIFCWQWQTRWQETRCHAGVTRRVGSDVQRPRATAAARAGALCVFRSSSVSSCSCVRCVLCKFELCVCEQAVVVYDDHYRIHVHRLPMGVLCLSFQNFGCFPIKLTLNSSNKQNYDVPGALFDQLQTQWQSDGKTYTQGMNLLLYSLCRSASSFCCVLLFGVVCLCCCLLLSGDVL